MDRVANGEGNLKAFMTTQSEIIRAVETVYQVRIERIKSPTRDAHTVRGRHELVCLLCELGLAAHQIAPLVNRSRSAVSKSKKPCRDRVDTCAADREAYQQARKMVDIPATLKIGIRTGPRLTPEGRVELMAAIRRMQERKKA